MRRWLRRAATQMSRAGKRFVLASGSDNQQELRFSCLLASARFPAAHLRAGSAYAAQILMPKVIKRTGESERGFITTLLTPVRCGREPRFGVRQAMWVVTLAFGGVAVMRLLLAQ